MSEGIYTALSGAIATQTQLEVSSHNLANVATPGFRNKRVSFTEVMVDTQGRDSQVVVDDVATDLNPAQLHQTGNAMDVAMSGDGFFLVGDPANPTITRDGRFQLSPEGQLTTNQGLPVLDPGGNPIQLNALPDDVLFAADGSIWDQYGPVGQLGIVNVVNRANLQSVGDGLMTTPANNLQAAEQVDVVQGAYEGSNVNAMRGMTEMITLHRYFETMNTLIQQHRDTDRTAVRSVGKVG